MIQYIKKRELNINGNIIEIPDELSEKTVKKILDLLKSNFNIYLVKDKEYIRIIAQKNNIQYHISRMKPYDNVISFFDKLKKSLNNMGG